MSDKRDVETVVTLGPERGGGWLQTMATVEEVTWWLDRIEGDKPY